MFFFTSNDSNFFDLFDPKHESTVWILMRILYAFALMFAISTKLRAELDDQDIPTKCACLLTVLLLTQIVTFDIFWIGLICAPLSLITSLLIPAVTYNFVYNEDQGKFVTRYVNNFLITI